MRLIPVLLSFVLLACSPTWPSLSVSSITDPVRSLWSSTKAGTGPEGVVDQWVRAGLPNRLLVFGDTGQCDEARHPREPVTALGTVLQDRPGLILVAGDIAYPDGKAVDFAECFDPALGAFKSRMLPVPGNHEYHVADATPYFDYFGPAAGKRGQGWYSVNFAHWHIIGLNSSLPLDANSEQLAWLKKDLDSAPKGCLLAFMHHPRWSSGGHSNTLAIDPVWQLLAAAKADLVIAGHDHHYERFVPINGAGQADSDGIREFVVGTGGAQIYDPPKPQPGSEVRNAKTYGLLELDLSDSAYSWRFLAVNDSDFEDRGAASCHQKR